jgi:hypothetical protein
MTPDAIVTAIVAALSTGAAKGATDAAKTAVVDAYGGLKSLIKIRFGGHSEAAVAIDRLEAKPDSDGRRQTLSEELQSANVGTDPEIASAAQALLALIRALPDGEKNIQFAQGQGIAQADRGSTATVSLYAGPGKDD